MALSAAGGTAWAAGETLVYEDLYVKEGLVMWLDGSDSSTIDLAGGTWASKVGGAVATVTGDWTAIKGGISYTAAEVKTGDGVERDFYSIDLGIANLPPRGLYRGGGYPHQGYHHSHG